MTQNQSWWSGSDGGELTSAEKAMLGQRRDNFETKNLKKN
tara:strand:+ start:165 stop:284 length:120 start_codon:yes stop_codon:yes gene_type:complete